MQDDLHTEVVDEEEARRISESMIETMNAEQKEAFDTLIESARHGQSAQHNCFFLEVFLNI